MIGEGVSLTTVMQGVNVDVKLQLLVRVSGPVHPTRSGARRMFHIYKCTEGTQKSDFNEQWTPQFCTPLLCLGYSVILPNVFISAISFTNT